MPALTIGLDIAKNVFQIHGVDRHGNAVVQRKLRRVEMLKYFANLEPSLVGIEACHGSHYWARELSALGHTVRLLPTQYVKPFLVGGKNDANDASAICAAVTRQDIRFVSIKSAEQQSLQSVHRMRERLVQDRTAKSNQMRSMFAEEGFVFPIGLHQLRKGIVGLLGDPNSRITPVLRRLGAMYLEQMDALQQWINELSNEIAELFKCSEVCQRLSTVPGIGPVIATALVSCVGDPSQFKNGRQFAAWLGLTPRQRSSGGKTRLGGITKRGDTYLRTLLVQGAHAVIHFVNRRDDRHSRWIKTLMQRRHPSVATVALANKTARIAWAILTGKEAFNAA